MQSKIREELPPLPRRWQSLPIDERGYPVPFFVAYRDGKPDHRVADPQKKFQCVAKNLCWLCGQRLGGYLAFVIGPMCTITRATSEPAQHYECSNYAVRSCPHLTRPEAQRREAGLEHSVSPGGIMLRQNPGVMAIWVSRMYAPHREKGLFRLYGPIRVEWWKEGRRATHQEVMSAFEASCPILREYAEKDGMEAVYEYERMLSIAKRYIPPV